MRLRVRLLIAALLCLAPVPGDIGSCGQPAIPLDADRFFRSKKALDCIRCDDCGFEFASCNEACDRQSAVDDFPQLCAPLVHDGEVCLRKLLAASCDEYRDYVRDRSPSVPTECNFCPERSE